MNKQVEVTSPDPYSTARDGDTCSLEVTIVKLDSAFNDLLDFLNEIKFESQLDTTTPSAPYRVKYTMGNWLGTLMGAFMDSCLNCMPQNEVALYTTSDENTQIRIQMLHLQKAIPVWQWLSSQDNIDCVYNRILHFKSRGNDLSKGNHWSGALDNYSRALQLSCLLSNMLASKSDATECDKYSQESFIQLHMSLCSNISLCQMKSKSYDYVIANSTRIIDSNLFGAIYDQQDSPYIALTTKSLYRRGWAYHAIGKLDEAAEDLHKALQLSPDNPEILSLWKVVTEKIKQHDRQMGNKLKAMFN